MMPPGMDPNETMEAPEPPEMPGVPDEPEMPMGMPGLQPGAPPIANENEQLAAQMPQAPGVPYDRVPSFAEEVLDGEEELINTLVQRGSTLELMLNREERQALVDRIIRDFDDAEASIGKYKEKRLQYLDTWQATPVQKDAPFEGASNIRLPLTSSFVEQMKARYYKALLGNDKIVEFSSLDQTYTQEELNELNDWFSYELNEVVNIRQVVHDLLHPMFLYGDAIAVPEYQRKVRNLTSMREFEILDNVPMAAQVKDALRLITQENITQQDIPTVDSKAIGVYDLTYTNDGIKTHGKISFRICNERLCAEITRPEVVFDGVYVHRLGLDDIVVINSMPTLDELPFFGVRLFQTVHDFMVAATNGEYLELTEEELSSIRAQARYKRGDYISQPSQEAQDQREGTDSADSAAFDMARKFLELYRWEGRWSPDSMSNPADAQQGGEQDEIGIVAWTEPRSRTLVRIERIENLCKDGGCTGVKFGYIEQPDRFFSIGMVEWLQHLQVELEAIHNQRLDAGTVANMPFGFYTPLAGLDMTTFKMAPGKLFAVKDPNGIVFPKLPWSSNWSFEQEQNVKGWAQDQAGLGNPSMGSFESKRTSASEFVGTTTSVDIRTEYLVEGFFRSFRSLLYKILGHYQQFSKDGRIYQVTGLDGERVVKTLSRDRLNGKLKLHLTANVAQLSAEVERSTAMNMLSIVMTPLLSQTGIVKPDTIYAAVDKVVRANNYTGVPFHKPDTLPDSDPPEVEHKRMLLGEIVQPNPGENFGEHLAAHIRLLSHPSFAAYFPLEEARQALQQHVQQTQQMQQAVQMQQQQQAMLAEQAKGTMAEMGVRPGLAGGGSPGDGAGPGTEAEGVGKPTEPFDDNQLDS